MIKTINKSSNYYCEIDDCNFLVTVYTSHVNFIIFLPTIFPDQSEIEIKNEIFLMEELEIQEKITYKLKLPTDPKNWFFNMIPMTNDVEFYMN